VESWSSHSTLHVRSSLGQRVSWLLNCYPSLEVSEFIPIFDHLIRRQLQFGAVDVDEGDDCDCQNSPELRHRKETLTSASLNRRGAQSRACEWRLSLGAIFSFHLSASAPLNVHVFETDSPALQNSTVFSTQTITCMRSKITCMRSKSLP
jgi:hypothetical protein